MDIDNGVVIENRRTKMSYGTLGGKLSVLVKNGVVVAHCNGIVGWRINFVGSSCPASAVQGTDDLNEIQLSPVKGQKAIAALVVTFSDGRTSMTQTAGIISLDWKGEKVEVDFEAFISDAGLVQVTPGGDLLITASACGQKFGTCHNRYVGRGEAPGEKEKVLLANKVRIVNDPNLLCRFLVGQATLEELDKAASGDLRTAELIRFEHQYQKMLDQSLKLQAELGTVQGALDHEVHQRETDWETIGKKNKQIMDLLDQQVRLENQRFDLEQRLSVFESLNIQLQLRLDLISASRMQRAVRKVDEAFHNILKQCGVKGKPDSGQAAKEVPVIRIRRPSRWFLRRLWCRALSKG